MAKTETTTKAKRVPKSDTEKRANFKTKATKATNRVLKALVSLRKLARPASYAWTPEEVGKIMEAIGREADVANAAFRNPGRQKAEGFTL